MIPPQRRPTLRIPHIAACLLTILTLACAPEPKPAPPPPTKTEVPKPNDESHRFPKADLIETRVVPSQAMGKVFLPGGTIAQYRKGKTAYQMFLVQMPDAQSAAIALLDWKKQLTDARLIPAFGGYFGKDGAEPVFVFTKGSWVAGVSGLNEKEADAKARLLAGQISF